LVAQVRQRVCEDVTNSGFFGRRDMIPIDIRKVRLDWNHPRYRNIFFKIFNATDSGNFYEYFNPYIEREFKMKMSPGHYVRAVVTEHVFVCPVKSLLTNDTILFYVSKEYNLRPSGEPNKPGRFVFGNFVSGSLPKHTLMLADVPADVYVEGNFDVESHYLGMRKYIEPGKIETIRNREWSLSKQLDIEKL
jgi:hypothetical protein